MKKLIENNLEIVKELLKIDNHIMKSNLKVEDLLLHSLDKTSYSFTASLIFYDGDPITTIKLANSDIQNSILYPNHSYLGINQFLISNSVLNLSLLKNDFKYEYAQDVFDHIIVINAKEAFEEIKKHYSKAIYIEI